MSKPCANNVLDSISKLFSKNKSKRNSQEKLSTRKLVKKVEVPRNRTAPTTITTTQSLQYRQALTSVRSCKTLRSPLNMTLVIFIHPNSLFQTLDQVLISHYMRFSIVVYCEQLRKISYLSGLLQEDWVVVRACSDDRIPCVARAFIASLFSLCVG